MIRNKIYIAWDIGGAHLKRCIMDWRKHSCSIFLCELWKNNCLQEIINKTNKTYGKKREVLNIVTMSGEMSDIYNSRLDGVNKILKVFKSYSNTKIYTKRKGLIFLKERNIKSDIASSNWHVTAEYLKKYINNGMIIDLGSTTTDFILIKNKNIINKRFDDFSGLKNQELVYSGVLRTPIFWITKSVKIRGQLLSIIPENFSTFADILVILNVIPKSYYYSSTADGKDKTKIDSLKRLSRSFGFDYKPDKRLLLYKAAYLIYTHFIKDTTNIINNHLKKNYSKHKDVMIIGTGIGENLVAKICKSCKFRYLSLAQLLKIKVNKSRINPIHITPAYLLARMSQEIDE